MKPIHDGIPTDRAWQVGRRIYVRCGYKSQINKDMRNIGAKWDPAERALWVGSTKKTQVIEICLAAQQRVDEREAVKAQGRWVEIPRGADDILAVVKELGGVYDPDGKRWAMRSDEDLARVQDMIRQRKEREAAERAARREAEQRIREELRRQGVAEAEAKVRAERERIVAEAGRVATGETAKLREISTQRMTKAIAWKVARKKGDVVKLRDGRRGVIVGIDIWFTGSDIASSVCWHAATHDRAHWDFLYEVAIVEPTQEEVEADAAEAAERADAEQIHTLMEEAARLTGARADDKWTHIPDDQIEGELTSMAGTTSPFSKGRLILTHDGRVYWQHPGYYDDYVRSEGVSDDPELVERVRRLIAAGSRTRYVDGQLPVTYKVVAR